MMGDFADSVARLCIEKYNCLKKTGKPNDHEWTVLSGIVLRTADGKLFLVALATGTKCLGESELINGTREERGSRLSDSHAEVLARRAFLRYLYEQVDLVLSNYESAIFSRIEGNGIALRSGVSFHFFSSQTPCGDCSIFPKRETWGDNDELPSKIRCISEDANESKKSINSECGDIYRTGAKCIKEDSVQDPHLPGVNYHVVGSLRTKPGRGDPTSSLSCSDKIAKWLVLGLQGSLLSLLIPSIKLETITIGDKCPFSLEAMERGLYKRFGKMSGPKIFQARTCFAHRRKQGRVRPCPSSVIWCAVRSSELEIAVEGRKQGVTKKKKTSNCLLVSRQMLLRTFLQILDKHEIDCSKIRHLKKITYYDWKKRSISYYNKWKQLKLESFHKWPWKPVHLRNFVL
ncbi:tRNA-specific adenosine deaminase 1 [Pseudomyrmex gracilis]|uniref:tRNA-specific adenosine deaminase 1 n=1 Tax=Pseudomyrmex gracilis TaxID=219809 RepID=UPI000994CA13|nr:tRNA-specific adenosine deaminase 1 [Pseudomyrmex gracilis]